jgi:hypothetical protein
MIVFTNQGEIDIAAISTFGVSVKEGENPIGFFGTGLKYAIAVLLRTGHEVTIFSGTTEIKFGVRVGAVRGQEFKFVTMAVADAAPVDIGFTTHLGAQWDLWMAYREIACNCMDESGTGQKMMSMPEGMPDQTDIVIVGKPFEEIFYERHKYILEDEPYLVCGSMEIRRRGGSAYFYRGVRVGQMPRECMYTYNDNQTLDLTEDRTIKHQWEPLERIASAVAKSDDVLFLKSILTADDSYQEHVLDFHQYGVSPSETFLRVVGELTCDRLTKVNPTAIKVWEDKTKQKIAPVEITLTEVQRKTLERAETFCSKIGFNITYPIKVIESLGEGTLGLAENDTIYIAERAFHLGGTKQVASVLVEEFLHLKHKYRDCSRDMQNFLFEKMMSMGEEMFGEPL